MYSRHFAVYVGSTALGVHGAESRGCRSPWVEISSQRSAATPAHNHGWGAPSCSAAHPATSATARLFARMANALCRASGRDCACQEWDSPMLQRQNVVQLPFPVLWKCLCPVSRRIATRGPAARDKPPDVPDSCVLPGSSTNPCVLPMFCAHADLRRYRAGWGILFASYPSHHIVSVRQPLESHSCFIGCRPTEHDQCTLQEDELSATSIAWPRLRNRFSPRPRLTGPPSSARILLDKHIRC